MNGHHSSSRKNVGSKKLPTHSSFLLRHIRSICFADEVPPLSSSSSSSTSCSSSPSNHDDLISIRCRGGYLVRMHPLVLAALSPMLKEALTEVTTKDPVLVLPDVNAHDVETFFCYLLATPGEDLVMPTWSVLRTIHSVCLSFGINAIDDVLNDLTLNQFLSCATDWSVISLDDTTSEPEIDPPTTLDMIQDLGEEEAEICPPPAADVKMKNPLIMDGPVDEIFNEDTGDNLSDGDDDDDEEENEAEVWLNCQKPRPRRRQPTLKDELSKWYNRTCLYCGRMYQHMRGRNLHMIKDHSEECQADGRWFKCDLCDDHFVSVFGREKHLTKVHNVKVRRPFLITGRPSAAAAAAEEFDMATFSWSNVAPPRGPCPHCDEAFDDCQALRAHVKESHPNKELACLACGKDHVDKRALFAHIQTHTGTAGSLFYTCQHCQMKFTVRYELRIHIRRAHASSVPVYVCEDCGVPFDDAKMLHNHARKEHASKEQLSRKEIKSYRCVECGKAFKHRSQMERHVRSHLGIKPYPCEHCGRAFIDATQLKHHVMALHSNGARPFECKVCSKRFGLRSLLVKHTKSKDHQRKANEQQQQQQQQQQESSSSSSVVYTVKESDIETLLINPQEEEVQGEEKQQQIMDTEQPKMEDELKIKINQLMQLI